MGDDEMANLARDFIAGKWAAGSVDDTELFPGLRRPTAEDGESFNGGNSVSFKQQPSDEDSMANLSFKSARSDSPMITRSADDYNNTGHTLHQSLQDHTFQHSMEAATGAEEEAKELRGLISRFIQHNSLLTRLISSHMAQLSISPGDNHGAGPASGVNDEVLTATEDGAEMGYGGTWSSNIGSDEVSPSSQWETAVIAASQSSPTARHIAVRQSSSEAKAGRTFTRVRFIQDQRKKQVECSVKVIVDYAWCSLRTSANASCRSTKRRMICTTSTWSLILTTTSTTPWTRDLTSNSSARQRSVL